MSIVFTILFTAVAAALVTSYAEYKKNYNLWDLIKDKFNALRGFTVAEAQLTIKVAYVDLARVDAAILSLPAHVRSAIRRRV